MSPLMCVKSAVYNTCTVYFAALDAENARVHVNVVSLSIANNSNLNCVDSFIAL